MIKTTVVDKILTDALNKAKEDIKRSFQQKGLSASGGFERALEVKVTDETFVTTGVILGAHYTTYLQSGRRPNKEQTIKQARGLGHILEQWVKDKGIDVNPYAAAWKIVREGIKVPNKYNPGGVVSDVINENWIRQLQKELGVGVQLEAMSDIYNLLK